MSRTLDVGNRTPPLRSTPRHWPLTILVIWSLPGALQAVQEHAYALTTAAGPIETPRLLLWSIPKWWFWALATPFIVAITRRLGFRKGQWRRALPVHALMGMVLGVMHIALLALVASSYPLRPERTVEFSAVFSGILWSFIPHIEGFAYACVVATTHVLDSRRELRDREITDLELRARLREAQLGALRTQLGPHFLFNTLNAISVTMDDDVQTAKKMLLELSKLLRKTLADGQKAALPLREELRTVELYLGIEQYRFEDRLKVAIDVEPTCANLEIPTFLLQPLIENAIRHGISRDSRSGRLSIGIARSRDRLLIRIEDDGPGVSLPIQEGIGLSNARARLEKHYPNDHALTLEKREPRGTRVIIDIPAHEFSGTGAPSS